MKLIVATSKMSSKRRRNHRERSNQYVALAASVVGRPIPIRWKRDPWLAINVNRVEYGLISRAEFRRELIDYLQNP